VTENKLYINTIVKALLQSKHYWLAILVIVECNYFIQILLRNKRKKLKWYTQICIYMLKAFINVTYINV